MPSYLAYANIHQPFPFEQMPLEIVPEKLRSPVTGNPRVQQRQQARRLAHFLLWQLLKKVEQNDSQKTFLKWPALLTQIERTASGRPYFPAQNIDFNISHSGDWVTVLLQVNEINEKAAVGVDIEVGKIRNFSALMDYFAPPAEVAWFAAQKDLSAAFYRCWCLREAVLKSQGVGIVKLSEVDHRPTAQQIFSAYCPTGSLLFSAALPFYLAAFVNQTQPNWQFYQWNGHQLEAQNLPNSIVYQVNPK